MCKDCGKTEESLLIDCDYPSTKKTHLPRLESEHMDKSWILHRIIPNKPLVNEQPKDPIPPLFEHIFYTVSTAPTIIRTR